MVISSISFACACLLPVQSLATPEQDDEETAHEAREKNLFYRNPEERREAGLFREITDWLSFATLLEVEKETTHNHFAENIAVTEEEPTTTTLQLVFKSEIDDWFEAEVVFESEYSRHMHDNENKYHDAAHSKIDEAEFSFDFDDIGIKFGRINVPFGEYNSYFVIGPLLEFGETLRDAVMIDYAISDSLEVTLFAFESRVDKSNQDDDYDWGASIEFTNDDESIRIGTSYTSDLAESDEEFLKDFNQQYLNQVSAWSAYALAGFDSFEITIETVQALDEFMEYDTNANQPSSTNVEFAYFFGDDFQIALRYAVSDELEEAPEKQHGASFTWRPVNHLVLSFDYLYGKFKKNFVRDDDDVPLNHQHQVATRMSLEF